MLYTTTVLANVEYEVLGLVMGSKVRAVHLGRDFVKTVIKDCAV